jgi:hypothetical protein
VVSPPALEEPPDAPLCARGQSCHLRQLDFDGADFRHEQGFFAARDEKVEILCEAGAHNL